MMPCETVSVLARMCKGSMPYCHGLVLCTTAQAQHPDHQDNFIACVPNQLLAIDHSGAILWIFYTSQRQWRVSEGELSGT